MTATIRTLKIEAAMQGEVLVQLQVSSPAGRHDFEMRFPDQGSAAANEQMAREDLRTLCQEILESL